MPSAYVKTRTPICRKSAKRGIKIKMSNRLRAARPVKTSSTTARTPMRSTRFTSQGRLLPESILCLRVLKKRKGAKIRFSLNFQMWIKVTRQMPGNKQRILRAHSLSWITNPYLSFDRTIDLSSISKQPGLR